MKECNECIFWSHNYCHLKDELRFKTDMACVDMNYSKVKSIKKP